MIRIENCSLTSVGEWGCHGTERRGQIQEHYTKGGWQRLKGQRQTRQRGRAYSDGSQELVSKRGVTNRVPCTEEAEKAERPAGVTH